MQLHLEHHGIKFVCSTKEAASIAIKMDFEGPQPNHFGTDKASSEVLKLGGFTGDTSVGGSCNVDILRMIPHCNGTHTETVSHIVDEDIWVGHAAMNLVNVAVLVTVTPCAAKDCNEVYRPELDDTDKVITRELLTTALEAVAKLSDVVPEALIIRTLPNESEKQSLAYTESNQPPFLTVDAMEYVVESNVRHLLVDFPSVDRMYDDGLLTNHHLFWNVKEKTHKLSENTWQDKTITEMVYVDDQIKDGLYALNLQVPAFCSDAAPSRPVIMPLRTVRS